MSVNTKIQYFSEEFMRLLENLPNMVNSGECEALSTFVLLKLFIKNIESIISSIEEQAKEDRRRYALKENVSMFDREVSLVGKTTWDYKPVTAWNAKKNEIKQIEKVAQLAYTSGQSIVFEETGELIEPAECSRSEYIKLDKVRA